jgi:hypothetical protein
MLLLVPRMTPILRNRHEKVQEASINLIGRIGECQCGVSIPFADLFLNQPTVGQNSCRRESGCAFVSSYLIY